ncbi:MAG: transposase [Desulfotomaculum sp. 46_296]|nr:MAG: transposase [Desulfotomaculum sp. 46_296]
MDETQEISQKFQRTAYQGSVGSRQHFSVARRHGIGSKTLCRWIRDSKHKTWEQADANAKKMTAYIPLPQEFRQMENENNTLKKPLGEQDLVIAILRDLIKKARPGFPIG